MIYPPPGAGAQRPVDVGGKDPDRQLALMLVVLAIGTAALFYAAELRLSSVTTAIDRRFGGASVPITATTSILEIAEPRETPDFGDISEPPFGSAPPTFSFGAVPTVGLGGGADDGNPYPPFAGRDLGDSGSPTAEESRSLGAATAPPVDVELASATPEALRLATPRASSPVVTGTATATRPAAYPGSSRTQP